MKTVIKKNWKLVLAVSLIVALMGSVAVGFQRFRQLEIMKQELNLDGLFINIKGVEVKTKDSGFFSEKPYEKIVIKIPSIASEGDDATKEGQNQVNQILDREKLGDGFASWLTNTFNSDVAKNYTDSIEVWYRDNKIIDEPKDNEKWSEQNN